MPADGDHVRSLFEITYIILDFNHSLISLACYGCKWLWLPGNRWHITRCRSFYVPVSSFHRQIFTSILTLYIVISTMEITFDPCSNLHVSAVIERHEGFFHRIKGEVFLWILSYHHPHPLPIMSSDQCAQNPDGSLKYLKAILWFNDAEDVQPLPSPAQPLGRGHRNKATNRFSDALVREQLASDEEEITTFTKVPKHKRTVRASNFSDGSGPPTLSSSNSFETLPVEETSDDNEDDSFKSDSGSESDSDSSDNSAPDLKLISNDEVRAQLFSHALECLPHIIAARQCSAKEDSCRSQPW